MQRDLAKEKSTPHKVAAEPSSEQLIDAIELMFFAYRDFVAHPDAILRKYNLGRAHHRALHFIARQPNISVAELLDILGITKQSLARVLKELLNQGYVVQSTGKKDRRQRLLNLTNKGTKFLDELLAPQKERFQHLINQSTPEMMDIWQNIMMNLINAQNRPMILERMKSLTLSDERIKTDGTKYGAGS